eukprot:TRINITY_DN3505_c0_g1_i1.p1 TRINITY_DN3505_c0_g1~~TRINITY_DN3505_c0_g1_i1.p1  ORF type:complete len:330 (-),score=83.06 TRINITY_DN3505_c0_g1_i1:60-1049(-)
MALTKAGLAREDVTSAVVYIYYHHNEMDALLDYMIEKDIKNAHSETQLFKEDTVLNSIFLAYSKLIGLQYLWKALIDTFYDINEVHLNAKEYETSRGGADHKFLDVLHLKLAAQSAFNTIRSKIFPPLLCRVMCKIRRNVDEEWNDLSGSLVATFVFLRFICLAITNPKLYGLWKTNISERTLKFIVLLSKVIQNTAFGVEFKAEDEMAELNDYVRVNTEPMSKWVDKISLMEEMEGEGVEDEEEYTRVEVGDAVKDSCVKWIWSVMWMNRQVVRRELDRKLSAEEGKQVRKELEEIGVMRVGGSSESLSNTNTRDDKGSTSDTETTSL